ncbi:MAG: YfhO family protein [Caldilineales bacterium]|nr:YfhO family protein [Caldilineales bacterium]
MKRRADILALLALTLAVLLVYSRAIFANLVPASGDFLTYFTPYWDYVNEALRAGRLPLWNPYMFAGAPLQANPQTAIFYPLRWPFVFVSAEKGILYSAAFHAWLGGVFTYALVRRSGRVSPLAGLAAALIFALDGWTTGLAGNPNRMSSVAWLPAALLVWEMRPDAAGFRLNRATRRWLVLLTLVWAITLLVGHSQTFYIQAVIFAVWVAGSVLWDWRQARRSGSDSSWRWLWRRIWPDLLALILAFGFALALSAVQLLPTLELTQQSFRSGGLSFREHAALSLPPWRLGYTLLPHYARDLGQALVSDAYAEWVAYVGLIGLFLAAVGLAYRRGGRMRWLAALLVVLGILLSLGGYNPLNYVLFRIIPGWDLFRVPARWLEMTMLGIAILAGLGVENLLQGWGISRPRNRLLFGIMLAGVVVALILAGLSQPNGITVVAWMIVLLAVAFAAFSRKNLRRLAVSLLLFVMVAELYFASYALAIQHPTAPEAIRSWRTAPTRIAAEDQPLCRTLSLSATTYDPGDLADLRRIYGPYLDDWAMADLIDAAKAREVIAPNLSLLARLPSLDGFDGGVLPTERFVQAMSLFLPADVLVADGRLREQLHEIPDARLLSLFHVCFVIADKQFDVWQDGVYYDLAFGELLSESQPELTILDTPSFPVSSIGLVSHLQGGAALTDGAEVAELVVTTTDGREIVLPIRAGIETAEGMDETPGLNHQRDLPAVRWRFDAPGQDVIARLPLHESDLIDSVQLRLTDPAASLFVRGLAFIDDASSAHATPVVSRHPWRRIHSGDVKIYRNDGVLPRAFFVPNVVFSPDDAQTLTAMKDPNFDPATTLLLASGDPVQGGEGSAEIVSYAPERIEMQIEAQSPGTLLIAEAWYPGWQAELDGEPIPVQRVDLLLQAVNVPVGRHELTLAFHPSTLRWGAILSLLTLVILVLAWLLPDRTNSPSPGLG